MYRGFTSSLWRGSFFLALFFFPAAEISCRRFGEVETRAAFSCLGYLFPLLLAFDLAVPLVFDT